MDFSELGSMKVLTNERRAETSKEASSESGVSPETGATALDRPCLDPLLPLLCSPGRLWHPEERGGE